MHYSLKIAGGVIAIFFTVAGFVVSNFQSKVDAELLSNSFDRRLVDFENRLFSFEKRLDSMKKKK